MKKFCVLALAAILSVVGCQLSAQTKSDSAFKPLFNGKDLSGWYVISGKGKKNEDPNQLVQVHDGMIHMYKDAQDKSPQPHGYIVTEEEFSHYHLRFEYKWGAKKFGGKVNAKRDCGLLYHVIGKDGVWPTSVECQVQEGDTGDIFTVNTRVTALVDPATTNAIEKVSTNAAGVVSTNHSVQPHHMAKEKGGMPFVQGVSNSIRRVVRNPMAEVDGWNKVEVIVRGESSVHIINGQTNNTILKMEKFVDGKWIPLTKGKLLLQKEGAEVFYRNIVIKVLDEK